MMNTSSCRAADDDSTNDGRHYKTENVAFNTQETRSHCHTSGLISVSAVTVTWICGRRGGLWLFGLVTVGRWTAILCMAAAANHVDATQRGDGMSADRHELRAPLHIALRPA